jgi:hypothetical protein
MNHSGLLSLSDAQHSIANNPNIRIHIRGNPSYVGVRDTGDWNGRDNSIASVSLTRPKPYQPDSYADGFGWSSHARAGQSDGIRHFPTVPITRPLREGRAPPLHLCPLL